MPESTTAAHTLNNDLSAELGAAAASWQELLERLPPDLEASARASGALRRRRGVRCAADLLRMVFAYAVCDWPLRLVGVWLATRGLARVSDVAILKRLKQCHAWLGQLIVQVLEQHTGWFMPAPALRVRIADATALRDAQHQLWRVHACFDLGATRLSGLVVTDAHGAETLAHFPYQPGEVVLADRGYAHQAGLAAVLTHGAYLVVRHHWRSLRLEQADGSRFDVLDWLRSAAASSFAQPLEQRVWLRTASDRYALRLLAVAQPPAALAQAHRRVRDKARKQSRTPSAASLLAADFVLVLTNLPADAWPAAQVLRLYRLRWQVELLFKRYKSLLQLDHVRARDPQLVQTYLLGKLLAALLADRDLATLRAYRPEWFSSADRPLSMWRVSHWFWARFARTVQGDPTGGPGQAADMRLERYLCDSPRRRPQQLAGAQLWLAQQPMNQGAAVPP